MKGGCRSQIQTVFSHNSGAPVKKAVNKYLIVDERATYIKDVSNRLLLDEDRNISVFAYLYKNQKEFEEFITKNTFDAIVVCNTVTEKDDFSVPENSNIYGFLSKKDAEEESFLNKDIMCLGYFKNSLLLLDCLENKIDSMLNDSTSNQEQTEQSPSSTTEATTELESPEVDNSQQSNNNNIKAQNTNNTVSSPETKTTPTVNQTQTASTNKFCTNCGARLNEGAKFCFECGSPVNNAGNQVNITESLQARVEENNNDASNIENQVAKDLAPLKHECKIVTVYAAKGGVGKTTITCELAAYLAQTCTNRRRTRVCVVDYNVDFGDVLTTLGYDKHGNTMISWAKEIDNKIEEGASQDDISYTAEEIASKLQVKTFPNNSEIYALIAPIVHTDSMLLSEEALCVMIKNLKENGDFDYIICDTGNNTRDSSYIALQEADNILLVCTQDITTTNCNDSFIKTMEGFSDFNKDKINAVINNITPARETGVSVKDIEEYIEFPCIARIKRDTSVIRANNEGSPLVFSNNPFTKEIQNIASVVVSEDLEIPVKEKKSSLFSFGKKNKRS